MVSVESVFCKPILFVPNKRPVKIMAVPATVSGVVAVFSVIGRVNVAINGCSQSEDVPAVVVCVKVAPFSFHVPDSEPPSCVVEV